jgi:hypothetical protein
MTDAPGPATDPPTDGPTDLVVLRRRRIGRWAKRGQRLGYLLFGLAVVLFFVAAATDLHPALVTGTVAALVLGSVVLAPSIVVGYGVRAADREEREQTDVSRKDTSNISP